MASASRLAKAAAALPSAGLIFDASTLPAQLVEVAMKSLRIACKSMAGESAPRGEDRLQRRAVPATSKSNEWTCSAGRGPAWRNSWRAAFPVFARWWRGAGRGCIHGLPENAERLILVEEIADEDRPVWHRRSAVTCRFGYRAAASPAAPCSSYRGSCSASAPSRRSHWRYTAPPSARPRR